MPVITQRRLLNCQSLLFRQQHSVYISLYYAFIYGAFIRTLYDATIMAFMLFIQQNHIYYVTAPSIISTIELINREPIAPLSPERFFLLLSAFRRMLQIVTFIMRQSGRLVGSRTTRLINRKTFSSSDYLLTFRIFGHLDFLPSHAKLEYFVAPYTVFSKLQRYLQGHCKILLVC
jgi:hypothetical protein